MGTVRYDIFGAAVDAGKPLQVRSSPIKFLILKIYSLNRIIMKLVQIIA